MEQQPIVLQVTNMVKQFQMKTFLPNQKEILFTAINNISFKLYEGEIVGLLGPNGAGKTTVIQMLLSTLTPTSGTINYFGLNFFKYRSTILQQVAFASTYIKLPVELTVAENLDIYGRLYSIPPMIRAAKIEKYLKFFDMWNVRNKETGILSAGQITRIMLAKAFLANPRVVLLDEPTAALDPDIAYEVRQFILHQQKEENVSLLITSHNMQEVTEICDRVLVLKNGTIIANNTPEQLAASIDSTYVHLVTKEVNQLIRYAQTHNIMYNVEKNTISLKVEEHAIAQFLHNLAHQGIFYTHISIEKPTLEDYFLHIARQDTI